ncbi:MAG: trigger factor [Phycisphaerales bacterium]
MAEAPVTNPDAVDSEETDELALDVKVEDAGPARKKLTITVPADEVTERLGDSIDTLTSEAVLPGFRRGHAPRKLVEKKFGSSVRTETRNQLLAQAYSKAIEDHKLQTVGDPENDKLSELELNPGEDFTFTVEVEVAPEFDLPDLKSVAVRKPIVTVTDEHITPEVERQQQRFGEVQEIEGEIQPGDRLVGKAIVSNAEDGELIEELNDAVIGIPAEGEGTKGHVLGLFVEDMHELFVGRSVGDVIELVIEAKQGDERPDIRGKKVKIEYTIEFGGRVDPATVAAVAEAYGLADEDALIAEVRKALEDRAAQEQQAAMREQVAEHLLDTIDFALPEKLSEAQARRAVDRQRVEMLYRGMPADDVETRVAEIRQSSEDESRNRLKLFFILARLGQEWEVEVDEREINGRVAQIAASRGERPDKVRNELAKQGRLQQIALQIREHKVLDRIISDAAVSEVSAEEWNEYVKNKKS